MSESARWHLSYHATQAAAVRGYSREEVLTTAADPEVQYSQENYGAGRAICQRGRLAVAVHAPSKTVITVLHRLVEQWSDPPRDVSLNEAREGGTDVLRAMRRVAA